MSSLRSFFEKAGLVVSDETSGSPAIHREASLDDITAGFPVASAPPEAPAIVLSQDSDLTLPEGVVLADIYAEAAVASTGFTIEKLAKLVEGLNQLDAATKKTAVAAMDSADESWKIEDVINDGRTKVAALNGYIKDIGDCERAINEEIDRRINANQIKKASALESVDAQIAKLQAERETAISEAAAEAANLRAQAAAAVEAAERERTRIFNSIRGFDALITLFDTTSPIPTVKS